MKHKIAPISSICSIILGGIIALISSFSFVIDIISTRNPTALALDIVVMFISYLTVWQGIYYTMLDRFAKKNMEENWEIRIKPVLNLMADTSGKINAIEEELMHLNLKVNSTMDYMLKAQDMDASKMHILPGASFKFISKVLVLIFFTFSSLVYVSSYPLGIVHYFITAIYVAWWIFLTSEYELFGNKVAWLWAIVPIMFIPSLGIIISAIYGMNTTIGIFFFFMLIYVYSYYAWACYNATGYKMLDFKPIAYMLAEKLKRETKKPVEHDISKDILKNSLSSSSLYKKYIGISAKKKIKQNPLRRLINKLRRVKK